MPLMDDESCEFNCYSVRRLNPFLGVMQIVETADSRAISHDGINWEIQILGVRPHDTWGAPSTVKPKRQFLRFGVWNKANGLTRIPANPLLDLTTMLKEVARLAEILTPASARIPFPLSDIYELWLLDDLDRMPLALLASTTELRHGASITIDHWVCSNAELPSPYLTRRDKVPPESIGSNPSKSYLERIVKQRASLGIQRWFKRTADDLGELVSFEPEEKLPLEARLHAAETFPQLLLNSAWDDTLTSSAIADYHVWLAPYLLTLQNLPDDLRCTLEREAAAQAVAVANYWRFYPKIINRKIIDAARVEARLRQTLKR